MERALVQINSTCVRYYLVTWVSTHLFVYIMANIEAREP